MTIPPFTPQYSQPTALHKSRNKKWKNVIVGILIVLIFLRQYLCSLWAEADGRYWLYIYCLTMFLFGVMLFIYDSKNWFYNMVIEAVAMFVFYDIVQRLFFDIHKFQMDDVLNILIAASIISIKAWIRFRK